MKHQLFFRRFFFTLFLFSGIIAFAQIGLVSGTIEDADGLPLPGVNIVIKGKSTGTQTDFDGDYRIKCEVGDILVVSYIGSQTREVLVTASMFGEEQIATVVRKIPVKTILDTTYQSSVRKNLPSFLIIPSIEESPKTYNSGQYLNTSRIKDISVNKDLVKVTYFDSDVYFEVGASSLLGMRFVQDRNLPALQKIFAQGAPLNGMTTYFDPIADIPFSYGPELSVLEFDGSANPFDQNGSLIPVGTGNGNTAIAYDNSPFQAVLKTSNNLFFNISTANSFYGFDYLNKRGKDLYGVERSSLDEFTISFNNERGYHTLEWNAQVKYLTSRENQPNINGFQNNLLFSALGTPPSFENNQSSTLSNGMQRSFSVSNLNNPQWLLNSNRNRLDNEVWIGILNNELNLGDEVKLNTKLGYTLSKNDQKFGLFKNTVGFLEGYSSDKILEKDIFDANISIDWDSYGDNFNLISSFSYSNENLRYALVERTGFDEATFDNPQNTFGLNRNISRALFRWFTRFDIDFFENKAKASFINNAFTSTKQNSKWFLPTLQLKYRFASNWYSSFIQKLDLSASVGYDINYLNLFYNNQSHNSLRLLPEESLEYTANNDLFASDLVSLEAKKSYEIDFDFGFDLFDHRWNLNTVYYSNTIEGSVFPVWTAGEYTLQNVADIQNSGVEWTFDTTLYEENSGFSITPKLVFSTYRTTVLDLLLPKNRIPIAGFSSISKNLIKGESAGVLVGSRFRRDSQNAIIIDSEGFPLVDSELGIIGDPIPDFNLGFSNTIKWKEFTLDFVLDYQKGGDVWNGTQIVLNYLGTSEQSASERMVTGFVFQGVNEQGEPNTIPVDFANPENGLAGNRFVRYGFEGVAEEAIVDGSYFNLKSLNFSYTVNSPKQNPFFRELRFSIYGTNLMTISKFRGATPYGALFDQTSSQGLNYFNNPILSEVGLNVKFKI